MQNTLEDCDTLIDDDVSVFILAEDGSTSQRVCFYTLYYSTSSLTNQIAPFEG